MGKKNIIVIVVVILMITLVTGFQGRCTGDDEIITIQGETNYEKIQDIIYMIYNEQNHPNAIIFVDEDSYYDAFKAVSLSYILNAPILYYGEKGIPEEFIEIMDILQPMGQDGPQIILMGDVPVQVRDEIDERAYSIRHINDYFGAYQTWYKNVDTVILANKTIDISILMQYIYYQSKPEIPMFIIDSNHINTEIESQIVDGSIKKVTIIGTLDRNITNDIAKYCKIKKVEIDRENPRRVDRSDWHIYISALSLINNGYLTEIKNIEGNRLIGKK